MLREAMTVQHASAGDLPPNTRLIEVHLTDLQQLFQSLDPAPFRERDLDPKAEEFIVEWAREFHADTPIALLVHVDREDISREDATIVRDAIHDYFAARGQSIRKRLRLLFRVGRRSLVIGLAFLSASILAGDLAAEALAGTQFGAVIRESLLIGGWVAMWRPIEIFLYDWWPIRDEARLYERLGAMPVRVEPHSHPSEPAAAGSSRGNPRAT